MLINAMLQQGIGLTYTQTCRLKPTTETFHYVLNVISRLSVLLAGDATGQERHILLCCPIAQKQASLIFTWFKE